MACRSIGNKVVDAYKLLNSFYGWIDVAQKLTFGIYNEGNTLEQCLGILNYLLPIQKSPTIFDLIHLHLVGQYFVGKASYIRVSTP